MLIVVDICLQNGAKMNEVNNPDNNYQCMCCHCGSIFIGHKREVCCPLCEYKSDRIIEQREQK